MGNPALKQTNALNLNLSCQKVFKKYFLSVNVGYSQSFINSSYINDNINLNKPAFSAYMSHYFTISPHISVSLYMNYKSAHNRNHIYIKETYSLSADVQFNLLKNRMKIRISGDNLLNSGTDCQRGEYKHVKSINTNFLQPRGVSVGITYNFNNFIDLFRKNDAGEEILKRAL